MDMKRNGTPGARTLEVNHIFHPVFLSGHFKSRFEEALIKAGKSQANRQR